MDYPTYELEQAALDEGYKYVVGTDEAGRGPGAGPVTAAAVYVPKEAIALLTGKVNDSKKLSAKKREELYDVIVGNCIYGVQEISAEVIDDVNILEATKLAMKMAIEQVEYFDYVLVDGTVELRKKIWCPTQKVIKGDAKSISIAAASIIAKVTRDRTMLKLHEDCPQYGWDKNKGYLTKAHIEAINTYGITEYHRKTFRKVGR
jgi:ribonuclease HII